MMTPELEEACNAHVAYETYSAYLYLSMSAWFEHKGLRGCGHWMRLQAEEELLHVHKFFTFQNDRGGRVELRAIQAPPATWASAQAVFRAAYEHECGVTQLIYKLVDVAHEAHDHATHAFLQWFVSEQVEEEATVLDITNKLGMANDSPSALLMIDQELGGRVINIPPDVNLTGPMK